MQVLLIEGFDWLGVRSSLSFGGSTTKGKWSIALVGGTASASDINTSGPPSGVRKHDCCLKLTNRGGTNSAAVYTRSGVLTSSTDYLIGFWFYFSASPVSGYSTILRLNDSSGLIFDSTGKLYLTLGSGAKTNYTGTTISSGTWHHIQLSIKGTAGVLNDGDFSLYIDGVKVGNNTGLGNTTLSIFPLTKLSLTTEAISGYSNSSTFGYKYYDDMFVIDSGTVFTGTYLPEVRLLLPVANSDDSGHNQFTPNSGTNWSNLTSYEGATSYTSETLSYVEADSVGSLEFEQMGPLPTNYTVLAVEAAAMVLDTVGTNNIGIHYIQHGLRNGGSDIFCLTEHGPFSTYQTSYCHHIYQTNPFTGESWTPADLQTMQAGIKITT